MKLFLNENVIGKTYILGIDGIKGITCIFIALFYHYTIYTGASSFPFLENPVLLYMQHFGRLGVEIFFTISGFLSYDLYYDKLKSNQINVHNFLFKKIRRLFPLMCITTLCTFIIQWAAKITLGNFLVNNHEVSIIGLILNFLGLQNGFYFNGNSPVNGPTWYISVLLICYFLFGIFVKLFNKNYFFILVCIFFIGLGGYIQFIGGLNIPLLFITNGRGYLAFFTGVLIAWLYRRNTLKNVHATILIIFFLFFVVFYPEISVKYATIITGTMFSPAIVILSINNSFITKILEVNFLKYFGRISYSFYLWQMPVMISLNLISKTIFCLNFSTIWGWLLVLSILMLISILSYELLEKSFFNGI